MIQKPNLLPPAYQPPPPVNWLRVGIITVVCTILVIFGVVSIKFYTEVKALEAKIGELDRLKEEQLTVQEKVERIDQLEDEISYLEGLIKELETGKLPLATILGDVTRVMPNGLSYKGIDYQDDDIMIIGEAKNPDIIADYVSEVRKYQWFSSVEILEITEDDKAGYTYEIRAYLAQEGGEESAPEVTESESAS